MAIMVCLRLPAVYKDVDRFIEEVSSLEKAEKQCGCGTVLGGKVQGKLTPWFELTQLRYASFPSTAAAGGLLEKDKERLLVVS